MNREQALQSAQMYFDSGKFIEDLARRIAFTTESQERSQRPVLTQYLEDEISVSLDGLGFECQLWDNPLNGQPPFLYAERREPGNDLTVLLYAHGDVVRGGGASWREDLDPWVAKVEDGRVYGRGSADNKGQHTINLGALASVISSRNGRLGFDVKVLMEMGEEVGSPGLSEIVELKKQELSADVFVASDGPRLAATEPTLSLGSRGYINFSLSVRLREKSYHSGNWGGLLSNPAVILANALATIVDGKGSILIEQLMPPTIPPAVKEALSKVTIEPQPGWPALDKEWGAPGLTLAEKLYGWNTFEVLALGCADAEASGNAIPGYAVAHCHMRFVAGTQYHCIEKLLRTHLDGHGYGCVEIKIADASAATRLDPDDPLVVFAKGSMHRSLGRAAVVLPNIGGSIPNVMFAETLGLPTLWIPHSYAACGQHAADEHLLTDLIQEGLQIMAGLWWDLGEKKLLPGSPIGSLEDERS